MEMCCHSVLITNVRDDRLQNQVHLAMLLSIAVSFYVGFGFNALLDARQWQVLTRYFWLFLLSVKTEEVFFTTGMNFGK